jgi:hypothetical protein
MPRAGCTPRKTFPALNPGTTSPPWADVIIPLVDIKAKFSVRIKELSETFLLRESVEHAHAEKSFIQSVM